MDLDRIEALLLLLGKHDVTEFRYKDEDLAMRLRLGPPPPVAAPIAPVAPGIVAPLVPAASPVAAPQAAEPAADETLVVVESPMVGTFYRASSPGADPFAEVGDRISAGQTLCIVEAMKLMNEIEAETGGVVVQVMVDDAAPVQFGQALFRIRPD